MLVAGAQGHPNEECDMGDVSVHVNMIPKLNNTVRLPAGWEKLLGTWDLEIREPLSVQGFQIARVNYPDSR